MRNAGPVGQATYSVGFRKSGVGPTTARALQGSGGTGPGETHADVIPLVPKQLSILGTVSEAWFLTGPCAQS